MYEVSAGGFACDSGSSLENGFLLGVTGLADVGILSSSSVAVGVMGSDKSDTCQWKNMFNQIYKFV